MYRAEILAHSTPASFTGLSFTGLSLMTALVEFPRKVLAEVVTHRNLADDAGDAEIVLRERTTTPDMSKNSASSRAIPLWKMIRKVWDDPFVPDRFSAAGPGMQAAGWLDGHDATVAQTVWLRARNDAIAHALSISTAAERDRVFDNVPGVRAMFEDRLVGWTHPTTGVHKQDVNRLLEPWGWVTQVLTADSVGWANFFALRCDPAADPAFSRVARMLYVKYLESTPTPLMLSEWHLPFVPDADKKDFRWTPVRGATLPDPIVFSAARCGWISYENHDKDGTPEQMRRTFDRFLSGTPKHGSPVEHQATFDPNMANLPDYRSNLRGWVQARKLVLGECIADYRPSAAEIESWGL